MSRLEREMCPLIESLFGTPVIDISNPLKS
jgi:hypothetical protein